MSSARQIWELFHWFKKQSCYLDGFYSFRRVSISAHLDLQISGGAGIENAPTEGDSIEGDPIEDDPTESDPIEGDPIEGDPIEGDPIDSRAAPYLSSSCASCPPPSSDHRCQS